MNLRRFIPDLPKRSLVFEAVAAVFLVVVALLTWNDGKSYMARSRSDQTGFFYEWRQAVVDRSSQTFDPPVSHWVAGLLVGEDGGFSGEWKEVFRATGTAHLTAVSGQNVGLILEAMRQPLLLLPLGRRGRLAVQCSGVIFLVLITGAPASVVRAAIMWASVSLARDALGRPVKPLRALLLAVIPLVLIEPAILLHDRGFQLSVLATFGIAAVSPVFAATIFRRLTKGMRLWASQSMGAIVMTAPLIAWMTGRYSVMAFAANLLVAAFIPYLMGLGAVLIGLGFIIPQAASIPAVLTGWIFLLPLMILRLLSRLPISSANGLTASGLTVITSAAVLWSLWRWRRREAARAIPYE
jgi:competence protein ComEC